MTNIVEIKTNRLLLRQWRTSDFDSFAQMNSSKKVMQFYPDTLSRQQSDEVAQQIQHKITVNGWGFWAVEIPDTCHFIGFVGLNEPSYRLPFSHSDQLVEVGWRLSEKFWGNGYATEAARSALNFGFNELKLPEIISFASSLNRASINVMKRLQMQNTNYIFNHPKIPEGHILQEHCLFTIKNKN